MKKLAVLVLLFSFTGFFSCEDDETVVTGFIPDQILFTEGSALKGQVVTISIEGDINSTVQVRYELLPGTAKEGIDLTLKEGVLEFSKNQRVAKLEFDIIGDNHLEIIESFVLKLEYAGQQYAFTLQIQDDDAIEPVLVGEDGFYTPATYPSMELIWADEFDGTALNNNFWSYDLGDGCNVNLCGWGNNEMQAYTDKPENIKLDNGKLVITARKTESGGFTSARIKTENKKELRYGRIDVRAKLPKGQGIWPAIWSLGENIDVVGWPTCGEIDIMELVGHQPATAHGTVHYRDDVYKYSTSSTSLPAGTFGDAYHVFTLVWDYNSISWYVDNKEFKKFTNTNISNWPFNKAFYFLLNVAVGGNWPGKPDNTTVFPQEMVVDYIRVFQ
jgi:beta-glucanase (GH16 family)